MSFRDQPERLIPEPRADDRTGHGHRQVIGWLGALLPVFVVGLDRLRPTEGLLPNELSSISAYHYSSGVVAFAGILAALAVYLITYRGYENADGRKDRAASTVAGWAAVLVILFPTHPPGNEPDPTWWMDPIGTIHYVAAVTLFAAFIYFCLRLFPKSSSPRPEWDKDKRMRNAIYGTCGVGMAVTLGLAVMAGRRGAPIFWHETLALELFAFSWLVKGKADRTAARLLKRAGHYATHPAQAVTDLGKAMRDGSR
jgi:hypothetical protein